MSVGEGCRYKRLFLCPRQTPFIWKRAFCRPTFRPLHQATCRGVLVKQSIMKAARLTEVAVSLLVLLFGYTAISKIFSAAAFSAVLQQVMPKPGAAVAVFLIPTLEAVVVLLLLFPQTRMAGLRASAALLGVFTLYLLYMLLFLPRLPCSCGGVVGALSWKQHVLFNLAFLGLSLFAMRREERLPAVDRSPLIAGGRENR